MERLHESLDEIEGASVGKDSDADGEVFYAHVDNDAIPEALRKIDTRERGGTTVTTVNHEIDIRRLEPSGSSDSSDMFVQWEELGDFEDKYPQDPEDQLVKMSSDGYYNTAVTISDGYVNLSHGGWAISVAWDLFADVLNERENEIDYTTPDGREVEITRRNYDSDDLEDDIRVVSDNKTYNVEVCVFDSVE